MWTTAVPFSVQVVVYVVYLDSLLEDPVPVGMDEVTLALIEKVRDAEPVPMGAVALAVLLKL